MSKFMKTHRKTCKKTRSKNVDNNGINILKNQLKMGAKIIKQSMTNHIENIARTCLSKSWKKRVQGDPNWRPKARGPEPKVPVRGKEFLLEIPGSRFAIANHHHTNNHQANK